MREFSSAELDMECENGRTDAGVTVVPKWFINDPMQRSEVFDILGIPADSPELPPLSHQTVSEPGSIIHCGLVWTTGTDGSKGPVCSFIASNLPAIQGDDNSTPLYDKEAHEARLFGEGDRRVLGTLCRWKEKTEGQGSSQQTRHSQSDGTVPGSLSDSSQC